MKIKLMVLALLSSTSSFAQSDLEENYNLTGSISFLSQYISRGFEQTWGDPALQGGLYWNHNSGLNMGTWVSSVSSNIIRDASLEWDFYIGYLKEIDKFRYGVTAWYYTYPGAKTTSSTGGLKYDYGEIVPEIGYGPLSIKYGITYTKDFFANNSQTFGQTVDKHSRGSAYLDVSYVQPINDLMTFTAHYGHMNVRNFEEANFEDLKLDLSFNLPKDFTTGITYTRVWDKDDFYEYSSNGEIGAPISNPTGSNFTIHLNKYF